MSGIWSKENARHFIWSRFWPSAHTTQQLPDHAIQAEERAERQRGGGGLPFALSSGSANVQAGGA